MRKILRQYIEAAKAEKEAKAIKDRERLKTEKFLRRCGRLGIALDYITMSSSSRFNLKDEELLDYLRTILPEEDFKKASKLVPDLQGMSDLIVEEKLDSTKIPEECYSTTDYHTIKINYKRI